MDALCSSNMILMVDVLNFIASDKYYYSFGKTIMNEALTLYNIRFQKFKMFTNVPIYNRNKYVVYENFTNFTIFFLFFSITHLWKHLKMKVSTFLTKSAIGKWVGTRSTVGSNLDQVFWSKSCLQTNNNSNRIVKPKYPSLHYHNLKIL